MAAAGHARISSPSSISPTLCRHEALFRNHHLLFVSFYSNSHGQIPRKGARSHNGACRNVVQCMAGSRKPRAKDMSLILESEAVWQRVTDNPYDGLSFSLEDFEKSISKYEYSCDVGDIVKGRVFTTAAGGAWVELGTKAPGFLPLSEASVIRVKGLNEIGVFPGVEDEFMVIDEEDKEGRILVSLRQIQLELAWERVRQLQAESATFRGTILSANRGGVLVLVETLTAFLPFSLTTPGKEMEHWIGKELALKFVEIDEEQSRLVVSNRKAMAEIHTDLGIGTVVMGTIQSVKPYGAFVDIGGMNGLLHISQVSNERITTLNNVLQQGDKLKVMILSQDKERNRISLSTKKLEPSPGDMLRNPALVFEKAEEMALNFRKRIAQAEAMARDEEGRDEGDLFGLSLDFLSRSTNISTATATATASASASNQDALFHPVVSVV